MIKRTIFCLTLTILLIFVGCNNGKVALSGKVTLTDGTPLGIGEVYFQTATYEARGTLKPDGTYTVGSISDKDGLPKGKYNVYIFGAQKPNGKTKDGMDIMVPLIDEKYLSSKTSGVTVDVPVLNGKFDFQVEPYKSK
ncbi:MAG: hypothetical protein LBJ67_16060 [Planctomycetaceae bacterium]|jgi:uncharacterized lipoprotein NlpE involved in copper resistance|nr:hypothetical protein [Planctomycetaceae bacterium]